MWSYYAPAEWYSQALRLPYPTIPDEDDEEGKQMQTQLMRAYLLLLLDHLGLSTGEGKGGGDEGEGAKTFLRELLLESRYIHMDPQHVGPQHANAQNKQDDLRGVGGGEEDTIDDGRCHDDRDYEHKCKDNDRVDLDDGCADKPNLQESDIDIDAEPSHLHAQLSRFCHDNEVFQNMLADGYIVHLLQRSVREIGNIFMRILERAGEDRMHVYVLNYVEHVVHDAFGLPSMLHFVRDLVNC